jgi:hypothetical protein
MNTRYLFALCILLFCAAAHAQVYSDTIRIDRPGGTDFYLGCDVVQFAADRIGAYCEEHYVALDTPPLDVPSSAPAATVVVFAFQNDFHFIDETGGCIVIGSTPGALGTTGYAAQCGDVIFRNGFEGENQ